MNGPSFGLRCSLLALACPFFGPCPVLCLDRRLGLPDFTTGALTVARAFRRAAHPERVFFGIFQQHNCSGGEDADFPIPALSDKDGRRLDCLDCVANLGQRLKCPHHPACAHLWQVRVNRVHWLETQGPTYGRAVSERLFAGEDYIMTIVRRLLLLPAAPIHRVSRGTFVAPCPFSHVRATRLFRFSSSCF